MSASTFGPTGLIGGGGSSLNLVRSNGLHWGYLIANWSTLLVCQNQLFLN